MKSRQSGQLLFSFARPGKKKGGLDVEEYRSLVERLSSDARRIAERFKLPAFDLDADRPGARSRYGICDSEGRIRVRLVNVRTGRMLKYSALVDTVVHELAHLRHLDHGPRWEALYRRMLEWARAQSIYSPREVSPAARAPGAPKPQQPRQALLFRNEKKMAPAGLSRSLTKRPLSIRGRKRSRRGEARHGSS
jgi:hypothetical protein